MATNRSVHSTRRAGARGGKGGGGPLRGADVARDGEGNRGRREKRGTPVGPKDRTDKGNSLMEDTTREGDFLVEVKSNRIYK